MKGKKWNSFLWLRRWTGDRVLLSTVMNAASLRRRALLFTVNCLTCELKRRGTTRSGYCPAGVWLPAGATEYSVVPSVPAACDDHPASCQMNTDSAFRGSKVTESSRYQTRGEIKNSWSHISTPPIFMAWYLISHRGILKSYPLLTRNAP